MMLELKRSDAIDAHDLLYFERIADTVETDYRGNFAGRMSTGGIRAHAPTRAL
jgi:hypothetical protein